MYKKNDPALLGVHPIGAESLRPSCRPLGFTSQPPPGAGSHLYPAQQDSARLLWALVGLTRLSWAFVHSAYALGLSPIFPSGKGIISHTARSVDFGLVATRWLYRRQPLGWGDSSATWRNHWPLFLYRGVRWRPVLLGFDGGEPFALTRLVGTSQPTEGVWVFASPFVSLL